MADALFAGVPVGLALALGVIYWHLLVRPDDVVALFRAPTSDPSWFDLHPGSLRSLRAIVGGAFFLLAFLIGLAVGFLLATG